jgi:hypothetical protein
MLALAAADDRSRPVAIRQPPTRMRVTLTLPACVIHQS